MSDAVTEVSFETCHRELIDNGGDEARRVYRAWRSRMEQQAPYQEVVSFVEGFTHRFLFTITQEMLESVVRRSDHALGKLKKEEVQDKRIEDFDTPFALHHLFHRFIEEQSLVPTWQDWCGSVANAGWWEAVLRSPCTKGVRLGTTERG